MHVIAADAALGRFSSGETTLFNMDFSIFQPFIWTTARSAEPQKFGNYDFVSREIIKTIGDYRGPANFKLVVSDLAFLELLDHTDRRREYAEAISNSNDLAGTVAELARGSVGGNTAGLRSSTDIASNLNRAIAHMSNSPQHQRLRSIVAMLKSGVISGLGDYFSPDDMANARNGGAYFRETLKKIDDFRSSRGHGSDEGDLNKIVDAWVVTVSRSLHEAKSGHRVQFLGPPRLRQIYGSRTQELSCTALSPFLELKAFQFADASKNLKREAQATLSMTAERIARVLARIEGAENVEDCTTADLQELAEIKKMLITNYYFADEAEDVAMRDEIKRLIAELADDPRGIKDRYRVSAEELQSDAASITSQMPQILSDDFLEEYELRNNKRIKQLVKKYT